jgi:hypothetical protein
MSACASWWLRNQDIVGHAGWEAGLRHLIRIASGKASLVLGASAIPGWTAGAARFYCAGPHACNFHPPDYLAHAHHRG